MRVGAGPTDQALAGGFTEGRPELDAGHGSDQRLVDVYRGAPLGWVEGKKPEIALLRHHDLVSLRSGGKDFGSPRSGAGNMAKTGNPPSVLPRPATCAE